VANTPAGSGTAATCDRGGEAGPEATAAAARWRTAGARRGGGGAAATCGALAAVDDARCDGVESSSKQSSKMLRIASRGRSRCALGEAETKNTVCALTIISVDT
jgi:hypothetical protein